jgi:hypothetical protein
MDSMTRRPRWAAIGRGIGLAVAGAVVALELVGGEWAAVGAATGCGHWLVRSLRLHRDDKPKRPA